MITTKIKNDKKILERRSTKGNIPINDKLLNKYYLIKNLFENEIVNNYEIKIDYSSKKILNIDPSNIKIEEIKRLACEIFSKNHQDNMFFNDNNKILVSKSGINESIEKICNNYNQRELLKEHLKVFSKLGEIIEHAKLVNQVPERKGRKKYVSWHYYIDGIIIDKEKYLLQFEVVSLDSGENHYRVQRIEKTNDHCGDVNI